MSDYNSPEAIKQRLKAEVEIGKSNALGEHYQRLANHLEGGHEGVESKMLKSAGRDR